MSEIGSLGILTSLNRPEEAKDFKPLKLALKEKGYPIAETVALVDKYFESLTRRFKGNISKNDVLLTVPSGSGTNIIPTLIAKKIAERYGCSIVPQEFVLKTSKIEAKKNLSLEKRNLEPIDYKIHKDGIRQLLSPGSKILIIDDVLATGESTLRLKYRLETEKLPVKGVMALVTIANKCPSIRDIERVKYKITTHLNLNNPQENALKGLLKTVFFPYTVQKLNRLERPINNDKSAHKALDAIYTAAAFEQTFQKSLKRGLTL